MTPGESPAFRGGAAPYRGGDPWADYRDARPPFTRLTNLADRELGASVPAAGDEFFAERENLLDPRPPHFDPAAFGPKGKVMDGWETRRRRGRSAAAPLPDDEEHDWALIRLGVPGVVRGIVVDTAHFRGNHPRAVGIDATAAHGTPGAEELLGTHTGWTELVPPTEVGGHAANGFAVGVRRRLTHLRLKQYPDGGIARLRVHGEAVPDPVWLAALGTFDLLAPEYGGMAEDASDRFYSPPANPLRPGRARSMDEGWETRRRRDSGHDWVRYRLAAQAHLRAVELDTGCYRGNAPGWAALYALDAPPPPADAPLSPPAPDPVRAEADGVPDPSGSAGEWRRLLPPAPLQPDTVHRFLLPAAPVATHVRLDILPDGGIARLRLYGSPTAAGTRWLTERHRALG